MAGDATAPVSAPHSQEVLQLLDWRRRIFDLYREIRSVPAAEKAWRRWRNTRDELYREHPQSPLPPQARESFEGLHYFPYDAALRVLGEIVPCDPSSTSIGASGGESIVFERFGQVRFELTDEEHALDVFWLEAYGGGLFLPFADATSESETYPAGRYLLDTVKGADLGSLGNRLVLDFNFAYNPSCAYDARWICPLAPPANRFVVPIRGGERRPPALAHS